MQLVRGVCWLLLLLGGASGKAIFAGDYEEPSAIIIAHTHSENDSLKIHRHMRHCEEALLKKKGVPLLGFSSVVAAICAMHMAALNPNNTLPCLYTKWSDWSTCPSGSPKSCPVGTRERTREARGSVDLCVDIMQSKPCKTDCVGAQAIGTNNDALTNVEGYDPRSSLMPPSCVMCV